MRRFIHGFCAVVAGVAWVAMAWSACVCAVGLEWLHALLFACFAAGFAWRAAVSMGALLLPAECEHRGPGLIVGWCGDERLRAEEQGPDGRLTQWTVQTVKLRCPECEDVRLTTLHLTKRRARSPEDEFSPE